MTGPAVVQPSKPDTAPEAKADAEAEANANGQAAAKAKRPKPTLPRGFVVAMVTLSAFTVTALYVFVYATEFSALQEQRTQHQLYSEFRGSLDPASPVSPAVGGSISPGTPVAMIEAPTVGVHDLMVVEGTSSSDLLAGPGHLRDSPLPGQPGQSIVMGKSVTAGAPFGPITQLRTGDQLTVRTGQGLFRYDVIERAPSGFAAARLPGERIDAHPGHLGRFRLAGSPPGQQRRVHRRGPPRPTGRRSVRTS